MTKSEELDILGGVRQRYLPARLIPAYEWTESAGELEELRELSGVALLAYCRQSSDNSAEHAPHPHDAVTADDLESLHDWLAT